MTTQMTAPATMLFDADCGLCTAVAAWLMRRSRPGELRAVPLQTMATHREPELAQLLAGRDLTLTLHLVTPGARVLTGSRAVLAAARTVPKWGAVARVADNAIGHAVLEPGYRWVARHRRGIGRALGISQTCSVPETRPVTPSRPLR
jgi:predicted DCC family thiol-disulfide oxidoreductase YuxK